MKKLGKYLDFYRGQWRARRIIPPHLQPFIPKKDGTPRSSLEENLGADPKLALRNSHAVLAGFEDTLDLAQQHFERSKPTLDRAAKAFYQDELSADDREREGGVREIINPLFTPVYASKLRLVAKGILIGEEAEALIGYAADDLIDRKLAVVTGKADRAELLQHLAQVRLDSLSVSQSRDEGSLTEPTPKSSLVNAPEPEPLKAIAIPGAIVEANGMDLDKLITLFHQERKGLAERTKLEREVAIRMLSGFLGKGRAVRSITRADMISYKNALINMPANAGQRFPGMTVTQAIKANAKRAKPHPVMDAATVNGKWLMHVGTIFRWAVRNDLMDSNPVEGVKIDVGKGSEEPARHPFTQDDIKAVFGNPFFTQAEAFESRHWALLIGLYTGARNSSEFRKTELVHFYDEQGIPVIHLAHASKNRRSKRIVPLHQDLLDLGLLEYVDELKERGETLLFPDWEPEDRINRWINRTYLKQCGVVDDRKDFYALRTTMKTALALNGVNRDVSDLITGHKDQSVAGTYIFNQAVTMVGAMNEGINRVSFGLRDFLSHKMKKN
jgi:hypothetical protein